MKFVTSGQMREADRYAIEELGLPAMVLMENAGRAIAEEVLRFCAERSGAFRGTGSEAHNRGALHFREAAESIREEDPGTGLDLSREHWLILVGKGNNGGDGLVCARHLADAGMAVSLLYAEPPERLRGEAAAQYSIVRALGLPGTVYDPERGGAEPLGWKQGGSGQGQSVQGEGIQGRNSQGRQMPVTGLVDALLGTGTTGAPRGGYASLIREANASGLPIIAADLPSGLDADTGAVHDPCIRARVTVSLAFLKAGLTQYPGARAAGDVVVRYIGIPRTLPPGMKPAGTVLTEAALSELGADPGRRREPDGHKGTYGHVLLAAGSLPMSGAGLLAAKAALRAGCGLATWALPAALLPPLLGAVPELMLAPVADGGSGAWNPAAANEVLRLLEARDVLAVGPGLGRFPGEGAYLRALWEGAARPLVVDADALNILAASGFAAWPRREAATVLTPHPGEMARLTGLTTAEVQRDRLGVARGFAAEHGVTLVLKGARTIVAAPDGRVFVNVTGHPGMATGGTGDCLTGIIAGLLAQGLDAVQAAALGVYLHGRAGERAAALRANPASMLAGDILDAL
ncbi:bifunctional NAD(P)H-hydrate repair enzyme [Paenibacillus faecis]|uniref:NAD(P)H-hydrate dehydratase n=1 Tax=Paenibacillus faecis TaxID=862114 RepID=UPI001B0EAA5A|nr:NAD(P)H-hydrate dehydratase [Paenibacillus faecis]GIO86928.1 bifunctional NAD(P)H-hydrate repair enzyme [Paenibacillus faecis]